MSRLAWAGLGLLIVIAAAYGYLAVQWAETEADVRRITRVVEGTPGEKGEPGTPGVGIKHVVVRLLAPDAQPYAIRRSGGLVTLYLPRAEQGPTGPAGPAGARGRTGARGPAGAIGAIGAIGPPGRTGKTGPKGGPSQQAVAAVVRAFLQSAEFECRRIRGDEFRCELD